MNEAAGKDTRGSTVALNLDCIAGDHDWDSFDIVALDAGKGGRQLRELCRDCGRRNKLTLSRQTVIDRGIDPDRVPVVRNRDCCTVDGCEACSRPCAMCGTYRGTQEHHYWPKAIFGGELSSRMPTGWLCQQHHALWHQKVTPHISTQVAA